jgi:hypothetical protein
MRGRLWKEKDKSKEEDKKYKRERKEHLSPRKTSQ